MRARAEKSVPGAKGDLRSVAVVLFHRVLFILFVNLYALSFFLPTFTVTVDSQTEVCRGYVAFVAAFWFSFNGFIGDGRAFVP